MPKMKSRSTAKKRFKRLSSGLVKRAKAYKRHLLTKKSRKTKRNLRGVAHVNPAELRTIIQLLPNR